MKSLFETIHSQLLRGNDLVLVTIIAENGSAPRGSGARMLIDPDGYLAGTVGGGYCEKLAEDLALECIRNKAGTNHEYMLYKNEQEDIGAVCGGAVTMHFQYISAADPAWLDLAEKILDCIDKQRRVWLIEHLDGSLASLVGPGAALIAGSSAKVDNWMLGSGNIRTPEYFSSPLPVRERAILFGAGHCSRALAPFLQTVGFRVTVFDEREAFANFDRFPGADTIICGDYSRIDDFLEISDNDYAVVMTSGHVHDFEVQKQLLRHRLAYIGVIGSKKKVAFVQEKLRNAGISEELIQSVHTPIGIKIKSVTPEEIAVSITAEMILCRAEEREKICELTKSCPMG